MDMDIDMDVPHSHHGGSGHGDYDSTNNHDYGYAQPYYTGVQWQRSQLQAQESPGYGIQYSAIHFGYPTPTPPTQPQAITKVTVIVDTNVLLDYLMVIQKFVADTEQAEWPSVVVIPSVVISELDWCVDVPARSPRNRQRLNEDTSHCSQAEEHEEEYLVVRSCRF